MQLGTRRGRLQTPRTRMCALGARCEAFRVPGGSVSCTPYQAARPFSHPSSCDLQGHAEAVQLIYDPAQVTYERLLDVFFKKHDSTTLNRQGGDGAPCAPLVPPVASTAPPGGGPWRRLKEAHPSPQWARSTAAAFTTTMTPRRHVCPNTSLSALPARAQRLCPSACGRRLLARKRCERRPSGTAGRRGEGQGCNPALRHGDSSSDDVLPRGGVPPAVPGEVREM